MVIVILMGMLNYFFYESRYFNVTMKTSFCTD